MKSTYAAIFSVAAFVVLVDQLSKYLVRTYFLVNETTTLLNPFLSITYLQNTGAGFGILQRQPLLLFFTSIMVIGIILFHMDRIQEKEKLLQVLVAFILGGAIGNAIDRVLFGFVTDFIDFTFWPVFNLADSFLTIGVIGLIWHFWKNEPK